MEACSFRAPRHIVSLLLFLPFCHSLLLPASSALCRKPKFENSIFVSENQCDLDHKDEFHGVAFGTRRVLEVNGTDLERSLQLLYTRESVYAAVLVYARWCPFSRALVPVFDSLASSFPSVYHFAVEEAALLPSAYSYYGIHSFPVLFLHNKTSKVCYKGPRTYEAITRFYREYSGFQPCLHCHETADRLKVLNRAELRLSARVLGKGTIQDELYLILSFVFLVSRVLFYLLSRAMNVVKQRWDEKFLFCKAYRNLLRRVFMGHFEQTWDPNTMSESIKGKCPKMDSTQGRGKALLSVPGWPSSSLAPVSLAEGSSSRTGAQEDVIDNGRVFKNYLWG